MKGISTIQHAYPLTFSAMIRSKSLILARVRLLSASKTLQKAPESQPAIKEELILHSDQGSQFTPKAFVGYCESVHITQSMGRAGYPYDNAPMERYFNTLKNDCIGIYIMLSFPPPSVIHTVCPGQYPGTS